MSELPIEKVEPRRFTKGDAKKSKLNSRLKVLKKVIVVIIVYIIYFSYVFTNKNSIQYQSIGLVIVASFLCLGAYAVYITENSKKDRKLLFYLWIFTLVFLLSSMLGITGYLLNLLR